MPNLPRGKKPAYLPTKTQRRKPTSDQRFYKSAAWKKLRLLKIAQTPFCEACFMAGILTDCTFAQPIDHVVRIDDGGAMLDLQNLCTLCESCHNRKSAMEKNGYAVNSHGQDGAKLPTKQGKEEVLNRIVELKIL